MTLACEDANSKLVEVVTVADVDDEDLVGNSLLQIWKWRFSHKVDIDMNSTLGSVLPLAMFGSYFIFARLFGSPLLWAIVFNENT